MVVWDSCLRTIKHESTSHKAGVTHLAFSGSRRLLTLAADGSLHCQDDVELLFRVQLPPAHFHCWLGWDDRLQAALVASASEVRVFQSTGKLLALLAPAEGGKGTSMQFDYAPELEHSVVCFARPSDSATEPLFLLRFALRAALGAKDSVTTSAEQDIRDFGLHKSEVPALVVVPLPEPEAAAERALRARVQGRLDRQQRLSNFKSWAMDQRKLQDWRREREMDESETETFMS